MRLCTISVDIEDGDCAATIEHIVWYGWSLEFCDHQALYLLPADIMMLKRASPRGSHGSLELTTVSVPNEVAALLCMFIMMLNMN